VILKEDSDLRGRQRGEIAGLIAEGLRDAGVSPESIEIVLSEADAVSRGVELMQEHDLLVILAADVSAVLEQLGPMRAWR
jgi:cyanophycin synthetase